MTTKPLQRGSAQPIMDDKEEVRGVDAKHARGLSPQAGHSPNEAGTDQRVEDAKRERAAKKNTRRGS
jgi:hypothetical protein